MDEIELETLSQIYAELKEENKRIKEEQDNCRHPGRQLKFNGGMPLWLCSECGKFMRYAKFIIPDQANPFWD